MSNYLWLLDAGHGGLINGKYVTAPKKMITFLDGLTIYEGVINRKILWALEDSLTSAGIEFYQISDDYEDLSLRLRVSIADNTYARDKRCIFLSIHSNAGGGSGFEVFTSIGQTKSDKVAQIFCDVYRRHFPSKALRSDRMDGDDDKESEFYVLRKTDCPALLVENLFFDNRKEAEYLLSVEGQEAIANCIFEAIKRVETLRPI